MYQYIGIFTRNCETSDLVGTLTTCVTVVTTVTGVAVVTTVTGVAVLCILLGPFRATTLTQDTVSTVTTVMK